MTIADAPWIREAERNGYPDPEPVYCPCCGEECDTIYSDQNGNVFACNWCLDQRDAGEWAEAERESRMPDWVNERRDD